MFVGMAGTAAASGFAVTIYEWHVSAIIIFKVVIVATRVIYKYTCMSVCLFVINRFTLS